MDAAPGQRFGPYEILSSLGAGGMGEVYRARDSRLGRDVALKLLPPSGDRARFEIEARAVAALNHPNIVAIHDVGENYIVTELVEGSPLLGPVEPVRRILDIAVQVADGLAAAHHAGILHRDLKPGNILITREGRVKILDFGLARSMFSPLGPNENTLTASGVILGTIAYMSPEQARGATLDHRSDQFSLGLVFHELTTGKQAFERATKAETLAAIIRDDPATLPATVPASLRWIIERCLAKDPAERYQSTRDLFLELRHLRDNLSGTTTPSTAALAPRPASSRVVPALAAAFVAALLTAFALRPAAESESIRLSPFAVERAEESWPAFSPDGHSVAWVRNGNEILVRAVAAVVPVSLVKSSGHLGPPIWSFEGARICYADRGDLWCVSAAGGSPARLLANVDTAEFTPDGKSLVVLKSVAGQPKLFVSSPPGTELKPVEGVTLPPAVTDLLPFSPDGRRLAALSADQDLWVAPWPAGTPRRLPFRGLGAWFPDSRHMAVTRRHPTGTNTLVTADTESGDTHELLRDSNAYVGASVSAQGDRIVYATGLYDFDVVEYSMEGKLLHPFANSVRTETGASYSPTGESVLYWSDIGGSMALWTRHADGSIPSLIFDPGPANRNPGEARFSPDGRRIAFTLATTTTGIEVVAASGGSPVRAVAADRPVNGLAWSSDGAAIWYARDGKLWKVTADGGTPSLMKDSVIHVLDASRDGRWIAVLTPDGVHLVSPDGQAVRAIHAERGTSFRGQFSADSRTFYLIRPGQATLSPVEVATGREGTPVRFEVDAAQTGTVNSIHPDRRRVLVSAGGRHYNLWMVEGFPQPANGWRAWFRR